MTHTQQEQQKRRIRRIARVRATIKGTTDRPRLCVRRSLLHIYAQMVDDGSGTTLVATSDKDIPEVDRKGKKKTEVASLVGSLIAERAKAKGIMTVVFDRRDKPYHGRVRAVADAAREAGLKF